MKSRYGVKYDRVYLDSRIDFPNAGSVILAIVPMLHFLGSRQDQTKEEECEEADEVLFIVG